MKPLAPPPSRLRTIFAETPLLDWVAGVTVGLLLGGIVYGWMVV